MITGTTTDLYALVPGSGGSRLVVGNQGTILKSIDGFETGDVSQWSASTP